MHRTHRAPATVTGHRPRHQPHQRLRADSDRSRAKGRSKTSTSSLADAATLPTTSSLLEQSNLTSDEWYRSSSTNKNYASYVRSGKEWLEDWTAEARVEGSVGGMSTSTPSTDPSLQSSLAGAFDFITVETPVALRILTAYKCEHLGRAFATAEGLRSAFKDYFERVHGCQGEFWKFNDHTQKWEGNPVFQPDFKVYYESLKNRDNRTGTTTQALPMLPQDMKIIMDYLDSDETCHGFSETRRLYWKAFATTAINLWSRTDELINLKCKHLRPFQTTSTHTSYHEFNLVFRKTNKDPTKGQQYKIPPQPELSEIDCFAHMTAWLAHLEALLQRPLQDEDYLFPAIAATGLLKFGEPISRSAFETLTDAIVDRSGVLKGRSGRFTTHCFRRGGAQYRFMWAKHKWSLKAVKWWGGWSTNEHVGTIMRYLLDELMAYEEGFSDIMMVDRASDRHESFMGTKDPSEVVVKADLVNFEASLFKRIEGLLLSPSSVRFMPQNSEMNNEPLQAPLFDSSHSSLIASPPQPISESPAPQSLSPQSRSLSPVQPLSSSPARPSRIPLAKSMDDVIKYWTRGDPAKGLVVPLKDWAYTYDAHQYTSEAQKLSNIRILYEELYHKYSGDEDAFLKQYPGLWHEYTRLLFAVRQARIARGDTKPRRRRKMTVI